MPRTFLSLGSNLGDRYALLREATQALGRGPRLNLVRTSPIYETEPVEVDEEQPEYLNCVVEVECGLSAAELLRYCQGVEAALGRESKGEKEPRTVDVDMLLFGTEVIEGPDLTVPHRGILRPFNLRCLVDLGADIYIPGHGMVNELLAGADLGGIRELEAGLDVGPC